MASRVTLKAVNDELARRGHQARLAKGTRYFYFQFGEAADWLDRTVQAETIGSRTLEEWIGEFERLNKLNGELLGSSGDTAAKGVRGKRARREPRL